jgi:NMD protein affecting ribosome stability and mRNA decay
MMKGIRTSYRSKRKLVEPSLRWRPLRREQLLKELVHDSYKLKWKLPDPTRCPQCGAVYHQGRWRWIGAPAGAHESMCPACRRIHDRFPAGYISLKGEFFDAHRDVVLGLVRSCETKEKAEHPLERIMGIERTREGALVTTTDTHLARRIAEALHAAYKGRLLFRYNKEQALLRVFWNR